MDAYDKMQQASFLMLEAFKDFRSVMEELKNDRGAQAPDPMNDMMKVKSMPGSEGSLEKAMKLLGIKEEEDYDADCDEDFPGRPFFKMEDLDGEDPRFYTGLEIGIPYAVAVRNAEGQGMLIPIKNGMFNEEY